MADPLKIMTFASDPASSEEPRKGFTLSWTYQGNPTRITLTGPGGLLIDGRDPKFLHQGSGSFPVPTGLTDGATFLLTLTGDDGVSTSMAYTHLVDNPARTFRNLKVTGTLTLPTK